jgi:AAA family ATP:ADP antiporter
MIEEAYSDLDERTVFISEFFSIMGLIAIAINVVVTPFVHRYVGIFAGLLVQPLILAAVSFGFFLNTTLFMAAVMKVGDRGLSYSINRASKELLYIPLSAQHTYQVKAWIDMLGYRLFKILGAALILVATGWLPFELGIGGLSILTFAICFAWVLVIGLLARSYREITATA